MLRTVAVRVGSVRAAVPVVGQAVARPTCCGVADVVARGAGCGPSPVAATAIAGASHMAAPCGPFNGLQVRWLWAKSADDDKAAGDAEEAPAYTVTDVAGEDSDGDLDGGYGGAGNDAGVLTAWFTKRQIKGSTKKLNVVAKQIRGLSVNEAVAQMAFSPKNRGRVVRYIIERAASNADFYHGWHRDDLCIQEAYVGKNGMFPRLRYHSRGRAGTAHLRYSQLTVHVRKMTPEEKATLSRKTAPHDPQRSVDPRHY